MGSRFRNNALSGKVSNLSSNELSNHQSQIDSSKVLLSGCTNGSPILLTGTSLGSVQTIHEAHLSALDEIWIYASNNDASVDRTLYLSFNDGTTKDVAVTIPDNSGLVLVLPGFMLTNNVKVSAYASAASKINIFGWANRFYSLKQRSLQGEGWSSTGE